jgi:hypothetical protein
MPKVRRVDVEVRPRVLEAPYGIELVGRGWESCPIRLTIAGGAPTRLRCLLGEPQGELVRPLGGEFVAVADVPGLQVGEHAVRAVSTGHAVKRGVSRDQPLRFHLEQWAGERLVGGSTYELRPAKPIRARRRRGR